MRDVNFIHIYLVEARVRLTQVARFIMHTPEIGKNFNEHI